MTQPLRRWHLRIWIMITILIPIVLVAGLVGRQDTTPANSSIHWEQRR